MKFGSDESRVKASLINLLLNVASVPLGLRFVNSLKEMRRVQWSSKEELHARSEARLALLLKHAAENVPYYRELYNRLGLDADELRTAHDLQALPIFKKSDYRACEPETFCATNVPPSHSHSSEKRQVLRASPFNSHLIDARCRSFLRAIFFTTRGTVCNRLIATFESLHHQPRRLHCRQMQPSQLD